MRQWLGVVTVLAGCAGSSNYVEPPLAITPSPAACSPGTLPACEPQVASQVPCLPRRPRFSERVSRWFHSGRGWTWGAASCGPPRDQELDRLMVDTLTSTEPRYSREPATNPRPARAESWIYP